MNYLDYLKVGSITVLGQKYAFLAAPSLTNRKFTGSIHGTNLVPDAPYIQEFGATVMDALGNYHSLRVQVQTTLGNEVPFDQIEPSDYKSVQIVFM